MNDADRRHTSRNGRMRVAGGGVAMQEAVPERSRFRLELSTSCSGNFRAFSTVESAAEARRPPHLVRSTGKGQGRDDLPGRHVRKRHMMSDRVPLRICRFRDAGRGEGRGNRHAHRLDARARPTRDREAGTARDPRRSCSWFRHSCVAAWTVRSAASAGEAAGARVFPEVPRRIVPLDHITKDAIRQPARTHARSMDRRNDLSAPQPAEFGGYSGRAVTARRSLA